MQKVTTFLTYNNQAEEAVNLYVSVFRNSKILNTVRMGREGAGSTGAVFHVTFQIDGQTFMALNGGPYFSFAQGISLYVSCETQEEIDELWEKLSAGGEKLQCGWLKDKFGVSWQIVPSFLGSLMQDKDAAKSKRVMQALLQMHKLDIKALRDAYERD